MDEIFNNTCGARDDWFTSKVGNKEIEKFEVIKRNIFTGPTCLFTFNNGELETTLDQKNYIKSIYTNEMFYEKIGREFCVALDVALAMSGFEAVVESYYSVIKTQKKVGGQLNDTLEYRTNVDWVYPHPIQCRETLKHIARMYLDGDASYGLGRHRVPVLMDDRMRTGGYKMGSKVMQKLVTSKKNGFILVQEDNI